MFCQIRSTKHLTFFSAFFDFLWREEGAASDETRRDERKTGDGPSLREAKAKGQSACWVPVGRV